jgi:hypothetical protein
MKGARGTRLCPSQQHRPAPYQEHDEAATRKRGATTDSTVSLTQPQQIAGRHLRASPALEATLPTLPRAATPASKGPRPTSPPTAAAHQRKATKRPSPCLVGSSRGQPQPSITPNSGGYTTWWRRRAYRLAPPLQGRVLPATPHRAERREIPATPSPAPQTCPAATSREAREERWGKEGRR